jgi:hypothetical protein
MRVASTRVAHLLVTDSSAKETCLGLRNSERRYIYQEMTENFTALKVSEKLWAPVLLGTVRRMWQTAEGSGPVTYPAQETHLALTTSTLHFMNCYF